MCCPGLGFSWHTATAGDRSGWRRRGNPGRLVRGVDWAQVQRLDQYTLAYRIATLRVSLAHVLLPLSPSAQGYGSLLMAEAERIALTEHRSSKIAVISGVGTRHYYRKLGYELEGPYMVKQLLKADQVLRGVGEGKAGEAQAAAPFNRRRRTVARAAALAVQAA